MNSADPSSSASPHAAPATARPSLGLTAWIPWALVVTLTILCLWLSQLCFRLQAESSLLRDQQRLTELELRNAQQHAEAERILAQRELADLRQRVARP